MSCYVLLRYILVGKVYVMLHCMYSFVIYLYIHVSKVYVCHVTLYVLLRYIHVVNLQSSVFW